MGWTDAGPTVEIHAAQIQEADDARLESTSTSTVRLGPRELDGAAARLRLFGVDDHMLGRALPDRRAWGRLVGDNPCGIKGRVVTFLDSGRRLLAPFRFTVGPPGAAPLSATCVPSQRRGVSWPVAPPDAGQEPLPLDVTYKDVSVLQLPDRSWLMVLARYRILAADPPRPAVPGGSLGDVVAWRALDPAFTRGLTGPHWLVAGRHALPDEARPAWLGVPSALVTGEGADLRLDVYYVVEPDDAGGRSYLDAMRDPGARDRQEGPMAQPGPMVQPGAQPMAQPEGRGPRPPGVLGPTPPPKPHDGQGPTPPPKPPDGRGPHPARPAPDGLASGVAVKRFAWAELLARLEAPAPPEEDWEAVGALPGELLGRVRVWAAVGAEGEARRFEAAYDGATVRLADPAPFACADRPALFLAAINGFGPFADGGAWGGHGVWRAAGLPAGESICAVADGLHACTPTPTVEGRDFVVAAGAASSPDRLVGSSAAGLYVDPDPVRLPFGRVRVAIGNLGAPDGPGTTPTNDAELTWFTGAPVDACRPWTEAWRR
ncbi:MAG: hypothetical protein V4850_19590 [Myxococcota bacterium]